MLELLWSFLDVLLHIDKHLAVVLEQYGLWIYLFLFLIIFCETGLVFTPFLPGDSLLFAIGALAAQGSLDIVLLYVLLVTAAVLGDTVNYWIGFHVGAKVFHQSVRFIKKEYLLRTEQFYEVHGSKAVVLARFIPIIRTFVPFIAGVGKMKYARFLAYNVFGGFLWITLFLLGGYYFGNIAFIKENFSIVILIIILLSGIPVITEFIRHRRKRVKFQ